MLRSIAVAYLNPLNFLKRSLIFGSGNGFLFICAFNLLKSFQHGVQVGFQKPIPILIEGNVDQNNVFEKLMEGKHTKIVNKSNDGSRSINDTDTFDYSMQDKMTNKSCEDNNYNNDYDELAYPFS
jgi:hypothetical protein